MPIQYYEFTDKYSEGTINRILNKYLFKRLGTGAKFQFVVLDLSMGNRVYSDTDAKVVIVEAINNPANKDKLILVPLANGNHFFGFVIDLRKKQSFYIDPFGTKPSSLRAQQLIPELQKQQIQFEHIKTRQQTDVTSCGPIFVASAIKFIEDYLIKGEISSQGFETAKSILATDRMFQMYINNTTQLEYWVYFNDQRQFIKDDDVMLAEISLWEAFFSEQNNTINKAIKQQIYQIIEEQKRYIKSFDFWHEHTEAEKRKIFFIKQFQSKLTELIFLRKEDEIPLLIQQHHTFFAWNDEALITAPYSFIKLYDLFSDKNLPKILVALNKLGISNASIKNQNLLLLFSILMIASVIGFIGLAIFGTVLSPWLAIPCIVLVICVLIGIKIIYNKYQLNENTKNEVNLLDILDTSDNTQERIETLEIVNSINSPVDGLNFPTDSLLTTEVELQKACQAKQWIIEKILAFVIEEKAITEEHKGHNIEFSVEEIRSCFSGLQEKFMIVKKEANIWALQWDVQKSGENQGNFFNREVKSATHFHYPGHRQVFLISKVFKHCFGETFKFNYSYTLDKISCNICFNLKDINEIVKSDSPFAAEKIDLSHTENLI